MTGSAGPDRGDRAVALLVERELDALVVTEPFNLRYLTGFTGTNGVALLGAEALRRFITDFRYIEQAGRQVEGFEIVRGSRDLFEDIVEGLPAARPLRVGFDDAHLSVRQHAELGARVGDEVDLVAAGGLVEALREVKDHEEVETIAAAAKIADAALGAVLERGLVGRSERAVALELEAEIRARGGEGVSFPPIVAAGAHGALPHAEPRDVEIPAGVLVVIDWGARLKGYCSDCTRTVATGRLDDEAAEVYELVRRAQDEALAAVRAGPSGREVDAVAREIIDAAGHGEHFGHGLGHGVGLEVHEGPRLSVAGESALVRGQVVTVEPGVYLPGRLGVRIEDLAVVGEDGARVLSSLPKELQSVG